MLKATIVIFFLLLSLIHGDDGNERMSKHYVLPAKLAGVTNVVIAAEAMTTAGPFFEVESDFANTPNLKAAAYAGSPGVKTDRTSVVDGIPLNLTLGFYKVATASLKVIGPLRGATIFIWHADAIGRYSSVNSSGQIEITTGQIWLRAKQTTNANGLVHFLTILPGWYPGRTVHFHLRVKLHGAASMSYVATTQMFLPDKFVNGYKGISPYVKDTHSVTYHAADSVYSALNSGVASKLVLQPHGVKTKTVVGYNASLNFGFAY
jgi:hypothetical protein